MDLLLCDIDSCIDSLTPESVRRAFEGEDKTTDDETIRSRQEQFCDDWIEGCDRLIAKMMCAEKPVAAMQREKMSEVEKEFKSAGRDLFTFLKEVRKTDVDITKIKDAEVQAVLKVLEPVMERRIKQIFTKLDTSSVDASRDADINTLIELLYEINLLYKKSRDLVDESGNDQNYYVERYSKVSP